MKKQPVPIERNLWDGFFAPRRVAVVGVSSDPIKPASRAARFLLAHGSVEVHAVGPSAIQFAGAVPAASVAELPTGLDVCLIAVPAASVLEVIKTARMRGIRCFVVFSAGFSETGPAGAELEREIASYCHEHGLLLIGPNSLGILNFRGKPSLTFASLHEEGIALPGHTAFVTQSGAVATLTAKIAADANLGFSHIVSTGNGTVLSTPDLACELAQRDDVRAVAIYLESAVDVDGILSLARRCRVLDKPLLVLLGALSAQGERAAASHTGSMAGGMRALKSLLEGEGAVIATSPHALVLAMAALDYLGPNRQSACSSPLRAAIVTGSGGLGVMLSDLLAQVGIRLARLGPGTQARLRKVLPPHASLANPVDVTATVNLNPAPLGEAVAAVACDPQVNLPVLLASGASQRVVDATVGAARSAQEAGARLLIVWPDAPMAARAAARAAGAVVFLRMEDLCIAFGPLLQRISGLPEPGGEDACMAGCRDGQPARADVSEAQVKLALRAAGITVPAQVLVRDRTEAIQAARQMGYPVVLKLAKPALTHKTEAGAVAVDLRTEKSLARAFDSMHSRAGALLGVSDLEFLVEEMAPPGMDLVLSVTRLPDGTAVCMVGAGGIAVEAADDVAFCLAEADPEQVCAALRRTRIGRFLVDGRRSRFDVDALLQLQRMLTQFFVAGPLRLAQLELNPVRVFPKGRGAAVLDALATRCSGSLH